MDLTLFLSAVLFILVVLLLALLIYSGLLVNVSVDARKSPFDELLVYYKPHIGQYANVGDLFRHTQRLAPGLRTIGIYLDDPKYTPSNNCRSAIGAIVGDPAGAEAAAVKRLTEAGYSPMTLPKADSVVYCTFPVVNTVSVYISTWRVYPAMRDFLAEKQLTARPFVEVCEGDRIVFFAPLSRYEEFEPDIPAPSPERPLAPPAKVEEEPARAVEEPVELPARSAQQHSQPQQKHAQSEEEHAPPEKEHTQPVEEHAQPVEEHAQPEEEHAQPEEEHAQPEEEHAQSAEEHAQSAEEHAQPVEEHAQPEEEHELSAEKHAQPPEEEAHAMAVSTEELISEAVAEPEAAPPQSPDAAATPGSNNSGEVETVFVAKREDLMEAMADRPDDEGELDVLEQRLAQLEEDLTDKQSRVRSDVNQFSNNLALAEIEEHLRRTAGDASADSESTDDRVDVEYPENSSDEPREPHEDLMLLLTTPSSNDDRNQEQDFNQDCPATTEILMPLSDTCSDLDIGSHQGISHEPIADQQSAGVTAEQPQHYQVNDNDEVAEPAELSEPGTHPDVYVPEPAAAHPEPEHHHGDDEHQLKEADEAPQASVVPLIQLQPAAPVSQSPSPPSVVVMESPDDQDQEASPPLSPSPPDPQQPAPVDIEQVDQFVQSVVQRAQQICVDAEGGGVVGDEATERREKRLPSPLRHQTSRSSLRSDESPEPAAAEPVEATGEPEP